MDEEALARGQWLLDQLPEDERDGLFELAGEEETRTLLAELDVEVGRMTAAEAATKRLEKEA